MSEFAKGVRCGDSILLKILIRRKGYGPVSKIQHNLAGFSKGIGLVSMSNPFFFFKVHIILGLNFIYEYVRL